MKRLVCGKKIVQDPKISEKKNPNKSMRATAAAPASAAAPRLKPARQRHDFLCGLPNRQLDRQGPPLWSFHFC